MWTRSSRACFRIQVHRRHRSLPAPPLPLLRMAHRAAAQRDRQSGTSWNSIGSPVVSGRSVPAGLSLVRTPTAGDAGADRSVSARNWPERCEPDRALARGTADLQVGIAMDGANRQRVSPYRGDVRRSLASRPPPARSTPGRGAAGSGSGTSRVPRTPGSPVRRTAWTPAPVAGTPKPRIRLAPPPSAPPRR